MKKFLTTAAFVALATTAVAADLPSRKPAPAPIPVEYRSPFFVGVHGGWASTSGWNAGAQGGYEFNRYMRAEIDYDYFENTRNVSGWGYSRNLLTSSNVVTGNGVLQYPLEQYKVTPYVIGGFGYRWGNQTTYRFNNLNGLIGLGTFNEGVWNVGAGARYELTKHVELDLRYRYMQGFSTGIGNHLVTGGVNYRF